MINSTNTIDHQSSALWYGLVSQSLTKYFGMILYCLCLFGSVMNIFTFIQRAYTCRACSLYLLFASIFDLIHLNLGALTNIIQYGFGYDWTLRSSIYCSLKYYFAYLFTIMSGTLTVFASVDRYLLSSEKNTRWKYSSRRVAFRLMKISFLIWLVLSLPISFCSKRIRHPSHNEQMMCTNPSKPPICFIVRLVYMCLIDGFLPPLIMMIVGLFTYRNVLHLHSRSRSHQTTRINRQITSMLILQSVKSTFASFPLAAMNFYLLFTSEQKKSFLRQAKENLVLQIAYLLFWSNYTSFFVYLYSSDIFRHQWIKSLKKLVCCLFGKRRRSHRRRRYSAQMALKRMRNKETPKEPSITQKQREKNDAR